MMNRIFYVLVGLNLILTFYFFIKLMDLENRYDSIANNQNTIISQQKLSSNKIKDMLGILEQKLEDIEYRLERLTFNTRVYAESDEQMLVEYVPSEENNFEGVYGGERAASTTTEFHFQNDEDLCDSARKMGWGLAAVGLVGQFAVKCGWN